MRISSWGATAAVALLASTAASAAAQELTLYGVGALDGDETNIQLLGVTARPSGMGLLPVVGVQVYRLQYESAGLLDDDKVTAYAVTPSVGLQYRGSGGAVEARVGYNFQDSDDDGEAPIIEGEGGQSGFTTTLLANSWATRPELQGVVSYSWESEFVWTQAQAVMPVANLDPGNIGIGAEVIYQAVTGGGDYNAWQAGPVVRFNNGRNFNVTLGAGIKDSNVGDNTYYARLTFVHYGMRL